LAPATDEVAAMRGGHKVTPADWNAYDPASAIEQASLRKLLATPPQSIDGIRAAISYILCFDDCCLFDPVKPFPVALLKSPALID